MHAITARPRTSNGRSGTGVMMSSLLDPENTGRFCPLCCWLRRPIRREAQTFANVPALSFTAVVNGANPLPQIVDHRQYRGSDGLQRDAFHVHGRQLADAPARQAGNAAPRPRASRFPRTLPVFTAGTYTGQVLFAQYFNGTPNMTVPVTLIVAPASGAYFGDVAGQASFSMAPGQAPPSQDHSD